MRRRLFPAKAPLFAALFCAAISGCPAPLPPPVPAPVEAPAVTSARSKAALAAEKLRGKDSEAALALALESLALYREALGNETSEAESALELLADIHFERAELDDAEKVLLEALEIRRALVGEGHPATAPVLDRLFALYERQGKLERAEAVAQASLVARETDPAPSRNELAVALRTLGSVQLARCRVVDAASNLTRALENAEASLPVGSPLLLPFLESLADARRYQQLATDALLLFERARRLVVLRDLAAADKLLSVLRRMLAIHDAQGNIEEQSAATARALVLVEQWLPAKDPAVLEFALPLAATVNAAGNRGKAVLLYQRLHLVEHEYPIPPSGMTTRLDPPRFVLGLSLAPALLATPHLCVPPGGETLRGPEKVIHDRLPALQRCYGTLPAGAPRAPFDARLVLKLAPAGEVQKIGGLVFDDVRDELMGCVLRTLAQTPFPAPAAGKARVVLPLRLSPDEGLRPPSTP